MQKVRHLCSELVGVMWRCGGQNRTNNTKIQKAVKLSWRGVAWPEECFSGSVTTAPTHLPTLTVSLIFTAGHHLDIALFPQLNVVTSSHPSPLLPSLQEALNNKGRSSFHTAASFLRNLGLLSWFNSYQGLLWFADVEMWWFIARRLLPQEIGFGFGVLDHLCAPLIHREVVLLHTTHFIFEPFFPSKIDSESGQKI